MNRRLVLIIAVVLVVIGIALFVGMGHHTKQAQDGPPLLRVSTAVPFKVGDVVEALRDMQLLPERLQVPVRTGKRAVVINTDDLDQGLVVVAMLDEAGRPDKERVGFLPVDGLKKVATVQAVQAKAPDKKPAPVRVAKAIPTPVATPSLVKVPIREITPIVIRYRPSSTPTIVNVGKPGMYRAVVENRKYYASTSPLPISAIGDRVNVDVRGLPYPDPNRVGAVLVNWQPSGAIVESCDGSVLVGVNANVHFWSDDTVEIKFYSVSMS